MHDGVPEGQNTTTAAPVPTTTEVRCVTHRLANLDVANPEAPPAAATTAAAGTFAQNTTAPIANLPAQEITPAVQSAATAAAAGVREDFIAALREMTQAMRKHRNSKDVPDSGDSTDGKRSRKRKMSGKNSDSKRHNRGEMSDAALAKRFNRCGKCARYIADPAARAAHVATCEGEKDRNGKDLFPTRMGKVRGLVENGKESLVNDFGKSKTK